MVKDVASVRGEEVFSCMQGLVGKPGGKSHLEHLVVDVRIILK
jgi:hypothetical protein